MKSKLKTTLAALAVLSAFTVNAAVDVTLHQDLELLAVNGEEVGVTLVSKRSVSLDNGTNQLVVRVSKLISSGGEYTKLRTDPVVVTFDTADKVLQVEPTRVITRNAHLQDFDKAPSVLIKEGESVYTDFHQGVLPRGTSMIRDIAKELENYNIKQGFIANEPKPSIAIKPAIAITAQSKSVQPDFTNIPKSNPSTSVTDFTAPMQAMYLQMTAEERKAFLSWAVQNVN
ncbi:DUF2057 family protein [Thaumasiovibrio sp. DFM-14]|uniref:YccT family protein n=1 Tax=Thaumasiovibrio sp. DFM-14 TaxID=3384792 RepID=UPI00399F0DDF